MNQKKLVWKFAVIAVSFGIMLGCGSSEPAVPEVDENFAAEQEKKMEELAKEQEEQMKREREMFQ